MYMWLYIYIVLMLLYARGLKRRCFDIHIPCFFFLMQGCEKSVQCPLGSSDPWGCTYVHWQMNLELNRPYRCFPKIVGFPPKSSLKNRGFPLFSPSILGYPPLFWKHLYTDYNVQCIERWEHESRHEIFHVCFWVSALTCTCQMFDVTTVIILCEWEIQGFNVVFVSQPHWDVLSFFKTSHLRQITLGVRNIHIYTIFTDIHTFVQLGFNMI